MHRIRLLVPFATLACLAATGALAQGESVGMLEADTEMVQKLLAPRATDGIEQELRLAQDRLKRARVQAEEVRQMQSVAAGRVSVKKDEIGLIKQRRKLAKKEGDAVRVAGLDAELKRQEAQLDIFTRIAAAARVQSDYTKALERSVDSLTAVREAELKLAQRREERLRLAALPELDGGKVDGIDAEISSLVRRFGAAVDRHAKDNAAASDALRKVVDARIRLLDRWEAVNNRKGLP